MTAKNALKIARVATLVFWGVILVNFFMPIGGEAVSKVISIVGIVTFAIHIAEILIFSRRLKMQENTSQSLFKALIFGMFEIITWRKKPRV